MITSLNSISYGKIWACSTSLRFARFFLEQNYTNELR